jgi:hypothetical protein
MMMSSSGRAFRALMMSMLVWMMYLWVVVGVAGGAESAPLRWVGV